ncbi:MAG: DUF6164 family protein [Chromatiales bacterium]|jgi:hypothetical protein
MSKQIFRLRNVPDDEAEEIRLLLREHGIEFYETPGGNWGISMPALWLNDENEHRAEEAKGLIEQYQEERAVRIRREYEELKQQGKHRRLSDAFRERPLEFIFYLLIIALILYLSTKPFLDFAQ